MNIKQKFKEFGQFCKERANKVVGACMGTAVALGGTVTALAADTGTGGGANEAVEAAKQLMTTATGTLNIANIVAIIGAGIGAVIGLFLAWWGARKLLGMLMKAFKKGKVSM